MSDDAFNKMLRDNTRQLTRVVGYIRKSTKDKKQKYSLMSQWSKIQQFANENNMKVVKYFQDMESGTKKERDGLSQALDLCEKEKLPLVVLRTDRLSRVPSQMFGLLENPNLKIYIAELGIEATPMMIGQFILYSSFELDMLRRRTKEGMKTALEKRRETDPTYKFGNPRIETAWKVSVEHRILKADNIAREYGTLLTSLYNQTGSYSGASRELNKMGIKTQNGKKWYPKTVSNILSRYNSLEHQEWI